MRGNSQLVTLIINQFQLSVFHAEHAYIWPVSGEEPVHSMKMLVKFDSSNIAQDSCIDAWDLRRLYKFSWRRQLDARENSIHATVSAKLFWKFWLAHDYMKGIKVILNKNPKFWSIVHQKPPNRCVLSGLSSFGAHGNTIVIRGSLLGWKSYACLQEEGDEQLLFRGMTMTHSRLQLLPILPPLRVINPLEAQGMLLFLVAEAQQSLLSFRRCMPNWPA